MADSGMPEGLDLGRTEGSEAASTYVSIPGGDALLGAEFRQVGADLLLTDGKALGVTLPGYFDAEHLSSLVTDTGVHLDGDLVRTLTPPQFPADTCQADTGSGIGKVADVAGSVQVQHADGSTAQLAAGDPVFQGDVLQAGGDGKIDIVFVDGTNFALGAGARMTLDELVFDPDGGQNNTFTATVLQGAFVFATGQIAPSGTMDVKTPVGTIGIRGTTVAGDVAVEGSKSTFTLVPDPKTGHVGKVIFTNGGGTQTLDVANATTTVVSFFVTPTQPVSLPAADLLQFFDQLLQQFYDSHGGTPSNFEHPDSRQGSNQPGLPTGSEDAATQALEQQTDLSNFTTAAGPDGTTITTATGTVGFAALSPLLGFVPAAPIGFTFTTVATSGGSGESDTFSVAFSGSSNLGPTPINQDAEQSSPPQQQQQEETPPSNPATTGGPDDDTLGSPTAASSQDILGNGGNDTLTGGTVGDTLDGGDGDDTLDAGPGDDQIFGGAGTDTVKYSSATQPITVDLTKGTAFGDPAIGVDTLVNIENVVGGSGSDVIIGDGHDNKLEGGPGDDQLTGTGGNDVLDGGDGADTAVFSGNLSDYLVQQIAGGYTVRDYRGVDGVDTLTNIENARFADTQAALAEIANKAPTAPVDTDVANNTVVENAAPGTAVGLTLLADDSNPGDSVTYSLTDDAGGLFAINADTGKVTVAGAIDYEAAASHDITVRATDKGGLFSEQTFTINVTNVNDNLVMTPTDTNGTANTVAENAAIGTAVGITANATDADVGAAVTYSLSDNAGGRFAIDATTGVVTVAGALDYETATNHTITVVAKSSDGSPSASQTFTIGVTNVNDNAVTTPTDTDAAANTVADTADVGTTVGLTGHATDADVGATVTYSLSDNAGGLFAIDATTGVVTVANLLDAADSHNITVVATSSDGSPSTEKTFTINVSHENSVTTPTDTDAAANTVAEDAAIGTTVGITASATDSDAGDTVTYSLSADAGGRFAINATTGVVTVAGALDYETTTSHDITVVATSTDGSISSQNFTIAVTNVNDNPATTPIDTNAAANTVAENAAVGTAVGITAHATDADVGAVVTYSLRDNAGGRFAIKATTGVVTVAGALDAETATSHNITVQATSSDGSPATTQIFTIAVTNVNDNSVTTPTDTNAATNNVAENAAIGTAVGITAHATDADVGAVVNYSLSDNAGGRFAINATTGVVTVAGALDAETAASHDITVQATSSDGSPATSQTFSIAVTNVNDNPVTVPVDTNAATDKVEENAAIGTAVGITAHATDADVGATVTYSLSDNAGGLFAINATTGIVTVTGALGSADSHNITVQATSSDGSPNTSQTFAIDVNRAPGVAADTDVTANTVVAGAPVGTLVGITAHATDPDAGDTVQYTLVDDAGGRFSIDQNDGRVIVFGPLGTAGDYNITVRATDQDSLSTDTVFTVSVTGGSSGNLSPELTTNALYIAQGDTIDHVSVAELDTTDSDNTDAEIRYTLTAATLGALFLAGSAAPLEAGDSFTQQDIADGKLTYQVGGGATDNEDISVDITDGTNTLTGQLIHVSIVTSGHVADGDVNVAGPLETNETLIVGHEAYGSFTVIGDTGVSVEQLIAADGDHGDAIIVVEGSSANLTVNDKKIQLGSVTGQASIHILDGATLDITDGGTLTVTNSTVLVDGFGSNLTLTGDGNEIDVTNTPSGSTGTLSIINGASVSALNLDIGAGTGHGVVAVSGAGVDPNAVDPSPTPSSLLVQDDGTMTGPNAGYIIVGDGAGSSGELDISDGGLVSVQTVDPDIAGSYVEVGIAATSNGTIDVSNPGTLLQVIQGKDKISDPASDPDNYLQGPGILLGTLGSASMTVSDHAAVVVSGNEPYLGVGTGNYNDPTDTTPRPEALLRIAGGGTVTVTETLASVTNWGGVYIGDFAGGHGQVIVTDEGSSLNVQGTQGSLVVGGSGTGTLTVEAGATATVSGVSGYFAVANDEGSTGDATVTGPGSSVIVKNTSSSTTENTGAGISVGNAGTGTLMVSDGGLVTLSGGDAYFDIGNLATGVGTVTVEGQNSAIEIEQPSTVSSFDFGPGLDVGNLGIGTLNIDDKASVSVSGTDAYVGVGQNADSSGELNVTQGGTLETLSMNIGRDGNGVATVNGVGSLILASNDSGRYPDDPSTTTEDETLEAGFITVGRSDKSVGELWIQAGAKVEVRDGGATETTNFSGAQFRIARDTGSSGTVTVQGAGSTLLIDQAGSTPGDGHDFAPTLLVGRGGDGALTIETNAVATVSGDRAYVSIGQGDPDSLEIADQSELVINSGGTLNVLGHDAGVEIGGNATGNGYLGVSGTGSSVHVTMTDTTTNPDDGPYISVGVNGTGVLDVEDGGDVRVDGPGSYIGVGQWAGSDGTMTVTNGTVELLYLTVGHDGTGELDVSGGHVTLSTDSGHGIDDPATPDYDESLESGYLTVGRSDGSIGTVFVSAGGVIEIRDSGPTETVNTSSAGLIVGRFEGSQGTVTVNGEGSEIIVSQSGPSASTGSSGVSVGEGGQGDMFITGQGHVEVNSDDAYFSVGDDFENRDNPAAPQRPQSSLHVESGGTLDVNGKNAYLNLGGEANTDGFAIVTGVGSVVHVKGPDDDTDPEDGSGVGVGNRGKGYLQVSDHALVEATGSNASIDVGHDASGNGTLTVDSGGSVTSLYMSIGRDGAGELTVSGTGSSVTLSNDNGHGVDLDPDDGYDESKEAGFLQVGRSIGAVGTLNVLLGAVLTIRDGGNAADGTSGPGLQLARNDGSVAHVLVDDGSQIVLSQVGPSLDAGGPSLVIGRSGQADMTITGNSTVSMTGDQAYVIVSGDYDNPNGTARLTSTLAVENGGKLEMHGVDQSMAIADTANSRGSVTVDGGTSEIKIVMDPDNGGYSYGPSLHVGQAGIGDLTINGGGHVELDGADAYMSIGNQATAIGSVTVEGDGSLLKLWMDPAITEFSFGVTLDVGAHGKGTLDVLNGGEVSLSGDRNVSLDIGASAGSEGHMTVDGSGSTVNLTLFGSPPPEDWGIHLTVGGYDDTATTTGTLTITNGGRIDLEDGPAYIGVGTPAHSLGTINISGTDTSGQSATLEALTEGSNLHIGYQGEGHVTVGTGGVINIGIAGDYFGSDAPVDDVHIFSGGSLLVDGGTINADVVVDGKLDFATGAINGDVVAYSGHVTRGESSISATSEIDGNFAMFGTTATLDIDASSASSHDVLNVSEGAFINNGVFAFHFMSGYTPLADQAFDFLKVDGTPLNPLSQQISLAAYNVGLDFQFSIQSDSGDALAFHADSKATAGNGVVFHGGLQDDNFTGTSNADSINGGGGNDTLFGGAGNDIMDGGGSSGFGARDLIEGGKGADTMTGSVGTDWFNNAAQTDNFHATIGAVSSVSTPAQIDQITNFDASVDLITFDPDNYFTFGTQSFHSGGPNSNFSTIDHEYTGTLNSNEKAANTAFGNNDALILDSHGNLIYDDNGDANGYTIVAHITTAAGSLPIAASNIQVNVTA